MSPGTPAGVEMESLAQGVIDSLPLQIAVLDGAGTILAVNRAWRAFARTGGGAEEALCEGAGYLAVCDAVTGEDAAVAQPFAAGVRSLLSGIESEVLVEYPCPSPSEERWFLARATRIVRDGPPLVVVSHLDITQRKKAEARLLLAQTMEGLGRLAGGVAHDFNNLLTVIAGFADLALTELPPQAPLRTYLEEIVGASARAAALTQQLQAFSRRQIVQLAELNLSTVLGEMERLLCHLLGDRIELDLRLAAGLDHVQADAAQIEQVILNLALNARDAMPQGGRLTIETSNSPSQIQGDTPGAGGAAGRQVLLRVADTGIGMDAATRARIFEPFFTTKETGKGAGLGLSAVYGIVRQCGGSIEVVSAPGKGAEFRIHLPRVEPPPHRPRTPPAIARARGEETLLVVDDEPALRHLTVQLLGAAGYRVLEAASGEEALTLLERYEGRVHLLLSDVVMPGMGGPELAARLAPLRPAMKILFMSGYTDDADLREGVRAGEIPFLAKPFGLGELTRTVREVLDS